MTVTAPSFADINGGHVAAPSFGDDAESTTFPLSQESFFQFKVVHRVSQPFRVAAVENFQPKMRAKVRLIYTIKVDKSVLQQYYGDNRTILLITRD